jgi:PPK2 family polyphosphate:nucleotide phosphotransferase
MSDIARQAERTAMLPAKLVKRFRIEKGRKFRLANIDPADTAGLEIEKEEAKVMLVAGVERLSALQERLYAHDRWALLIIFQAMDAAGKDSAIKHVMSGVNPQGCQVHSFKAPNPQELDHDYLWRHAAALPARGHIGIFNRSYYEEVLVVRVHEELLAREKLPPKLMGKKIWKRRFAEMAAFEDYLAHNGIVTLKFFLHVSKEEQRRRFLKRLDDPEKQWKFSLADVAERRHWDDYMAAYEDMIQHTATPTAPWYVVPADNKWFSRLVVAAAIDETLERLKLDFPRPDAAETESLAEARAALLAEEAGQPSPQPAAG